MNSNLRISLPDDLTENSIVEVTMISPKNEQEGIVALSEDIGEVINLRLFHLFLSADDEVYYPVQELAAFCFKERKYLEDFLSELPNMSALDMLILLNPITLDDSVLN